MKLKRIIVGLLAGMIMCCATVDAKTIDNNNYGFSIELPNEWKVAEKGNVFYFLRADHEMIMLAFYPPFPIGRNGRDDEMFLTELSKMMISKYPDAVVNSVKVESIAKQEAVSSLFSAKLKDGTAVTVKLYLFWFNDGPAEVRCMSQGTQIDEAMNTAMQSFLFKVPTANEWRTKGLENKKRHEYRQGIGDFSKAAAMDGKNADNFYQLSYLHAEVKEYREAIAAITKAIELTPKDSFYYHERAYSQLALKNPQAALADEEQAIRLNPNVHAYYNGRGNAYAQLAKYESALNDFKKAAELNGEPNELYFNQAQVLELMGKREEAAELYRKIVPNEKMPEDILKKIKARQNGEWDCFREWL